MTPDIILREYLNSEGPDYEKVVNRIIDNISALMDLYFFTFIQLSMPNLMDISSIIKNKTKIPELLKKEIHNINERLNTQNKDILSLSIVNKCEIDLFENKIISFGDIILYNNEILQEIVSALNSDLIQNKNIDLSSIIYILRVVFSSSKNCILL